MMIGKYCSTYRKKHRRTLSGFSLLKIYSVEYAVDHVINKIEIGHEEMFYLGMVRGENINFNNFCELIEYCVGKYDNLRDILKWDANIINVQDNKLESYLTHPCDPYSILFSYNNFGNTALIFASYCRYKKIVEKLVDAGCELNITNSHGRTALIEASLYGGIEIVEILVSAGCALDIQDKYGCTALIMASRYKSFYPWQSDRPLRVVKKLISARCSLDIQNNYGWTALIEACCYNDAEIVEELIDAGCLTDIKDNDGKTALDIAVMQKNQQIIDLLTIAKENIF